MSEHINNSQSAKQEALKEIIKRLHDGEPAEKLKKDFAKLIRNTSPEEIADMENALIKEGFPPEEIQRLCDVHAQVFEMSLKRVGKASKVPGHPIYTFLEENKEAKKILKDLVKAGKRVAKDQRSNTVIQEFNHLLERIQQIDIHYVRKENQLFPLLEAKQLTGPTQVMWGKHDEIRDMLRDLKHIVESESWNQIPQKVKSLANAIKRLIFLEEKILYPTSAKKLDDQEWAEIKRGEPEIGYAWVTPSNLWDASLATEPKTGPVTLDGQKSTETLSLSQGRLTPEQVDLMLKHLPVDITFVDENDKVCYYSDTKERIFPRSPAIIGRAVQNCHPPKSVHIVDDIVQKFKAKKKDKAEFWIHAGEQFIHIRYFPVFDEKEQYRGVIEVSQEVAGIRALEGEKRLLDWE